MIGRTLSHYRIVEKIGAGGMGEVYKAHDERLDRNVAIKVLPSGTLADENARKRFRKEALALSKLNHPNIATVFDFDTQEGVDFIVMELVEGTSLAEKVKTGALTEKEVTSLGTQIAEALEEAHERGVIHRDLKPGNIAVTLKGRVKVLDFGLARMLRPLGDEATTEAMTEELSVAGTLPYMSPEELKGERADHRSDLYSFGVVLYEMATGKRPFEEKLSTALTAAIVQKPPAPPSAHNRSISPGLESIILKALDKDPEHRYQSAREMRVDLERLSLPVSAAAPKRKPVRSSRWLWVATGVVAVTAILLVLSFGGLRDWLSGGVVEPIESLAVLPLENLSGDPEQEYFTEGMTEELIAELSKISALRVISRQSVMRFKDTTVPLPDIARALNVDAIVEGSVRRSGGRVRITTQLVQAYPEQHLWAESYERDMQDILTLQSQVARAIAQEIQITLTAEEQSRLTRDRAVDPEVYEACLKARFHFEYSQPDEAKEYIQKAMTLDSTYAPAYALLARYYISLAYLRTSSPKEVFPKAREAATKALELDERLAEAHGRLAFVMCAYDWDWLGAEIEYRRALELNPGLVMTRSYYSNFLSAMGRHEEAMAEAQKAQELDPLSPSSNMWMGVAFRFARRYDESIEQLQETTTMFPNHPFAQFQLGWTYCYKQMYEEAAAAFIKASNLVGDSRSKASLAHAYALSGRRDEALKILDELHELEKRSYVPPGFIAFAYIGLGQTDQALRWFEKAYEIPDGEMFLYRTMFRIYPYKAFRDDPRFQDLVRRMNFPQ